MDEMPLLPRFSAGRSSATSSTIRRRRYTKTAEPVRLPSFSSRSGAGMNDSARPTREQLLSRRIQHLELAKYDVRPLVDQMRQMAFSARDLARAADIYHRMLDDRDCGIILCLAGSLISAGLKQVFVDLVRNKMVDAIVSTG